MNPLTLQILNELLEQAEQIGRQRLPRVRLSERTHPAYFSNEDVRPRQALHADLEQLQGLRVHWREWQQGNWLEAVDLLDSAPAYAATRRVPKSDQRCQLEQHLYALETRVMWVSEWRDWNLTQLTSGKSVSPLRLEDDLFNRDFLRLVAAVAEFAEPMLERNLSVRLFNDSKRINSLRDALSGVLKRFAPNANLIDSDVERLRAFGLNRAPEYLLVSGPLRLNGLWLEVLPSVGIPATALHLPLETSAIRVILVENHTSFELLLNARPAETLLIFSAGFASQSLIRLIRSLARPVYHWGDLDVGGLRILAHLRSQLGLVTPLCMNTTTLELHRQYARGLEAQEDASLRQLELHPLLTDCADLIQALIKWGKLEQESIDVAFVKRQFGSD